MKSLFHKTILIIICGFAMSNQTSHAEASSPYRYIITETGMPTSVDPLDADNTSNLPMARMIYATPLETTETNQLTSRVLESFQYDEKLKQVEWIVKSGLKYEDGSAITAEDIAFSVARMAFTRPQFPVIESIDGLSTWIKSHEPIKTFPKGIKVSGNKITIHFAKDVDHPLFRFCLELFSIIPRKCVDPSTNKISCEKIPESGPYKVLSRNSSSILFTKRILSNAVKGPSQIRFEYVSSTDIQNHVKEFDDHTVIAGNEAFIAASELKKIEDKLAIKYTPAARFAVLQINQNVTPFDDKKCRQYFAQIFRQAYHELEQSTSSEGSIFTKILPGYLPLKELEKSSTLSAKDISDCRTKLAKADIPWGFSEPEKDLPFFKALKLALEKSGVKNSPPLVKPKKKDMSEAFVAGKSAFFNGGSGFWALDPGGDIKMLFTPNLHKPLLHVSEDSKLQNLIARLEKDKSAYTDVNQYLYEEARFNVYTHFRRFFASPNKGLVAEIPFAITSPAPWQVFKVN